MIKFLTPNLALKEKIEASLNHMENTKEKLKVEERPVTWKCDIHKKVPNYKQVTHRNGQARQIHIVGVVWGLCWQQLCLKKGSSRSSVSILLL